MRKSARGIKPSSKLLESKGIEVDGYTPTAVPDLQKARARDGENAVVVAPLSSPTPATSDSAAPAAASVDADAAAADADAASADAAPAPAPTPTTDTTDTITSKTTSRPSSASVASTTNEKTSRSVGGADSSQLASNAKMSASSAGSSLASASASAGDSTAPPQSDVSPQQAESAPLSSKGMFAKVVAAPPAAPAAETRLPAATSSANSSAGSGSAPKNSKRVHRTVLEDPLAKRCRLLEIQRNHFKRTLDRVLKLDRYGFILGKDYGGLPAPKGMMTLSQVMKKLEKGSYFAPHVMRDHDWANSRKIVEMLRSRKTYEEVKLLKKSDFLDINWDAIEADLRSIWTFVYKHQEVNEDPRSFYNTAKRLEEFVADNFASTRAKNKEELHKVRDEERLERLTFENREPAMSNWCKKPQERREYTQVDHYKVVEGITEEERAELEDLLDATGSENRWLLPEDGDAESALNARGAVKKKRRRADGAAAPVSGGLAGNLPFVSWRIKELGKDLLEVDSWGIDPFTRRNLSIALESIDAPDLRMTQPQVNWFIEGLLLRELNRQGPDIGWDLTHALKSLRARAQAGGALSSANSMSHFVNKNETEVKTSLVKTEDQDASTKEASVEDQNDTTMEDTKMEESPDAAVTTSATSKAPAEDETSTASKDADRPSDAAETVDVANSTATKPESSAASSRAQSADDVLASSSSMDEASASKENSENGPGETAAQHSKTKEAAPKTLNGAAKTTRGAAKAKLDSKASKKGSSEGNSTGEVDSLADVVEKIERVGRKRKRTNLVEHENIIWSSRRTRRKPEFFEAVPKVIVADQIDEDTPAASTTTRKRGRGSAAAASTTSRKTTRAGRGKAKTAASQSVANGTSSRKRKAGRGRGGARSRSSTRGGRKAKANEDLSEVDDIDAENEDDGTEGTTAEGRKLVGKRLSVFRPVECAWFSGRITAYNQNPKEEGRHHCVLFDNGEEAWVDILKDRCIVENVANTTYDRNVSDEMIVAAVDVILRSLQSWGQHNFCVHPKGVGVICLNDKGIQKGDILGSYHGELYPLWLWEQKEAREDALRKQTRAGKTTLPDFWNMRFEIPSSEPNGFTILYVDSKHLGTSMSRLSHSCRPNACVMMAIVDGKYNIAMRALRDIEPGEEVTIDYNCVTDSMDEFRAAICLCGSEGCRGSFLYITGAQQFMQVVERRHQPVHRAAMLFEASLDSQGKPPAASKPVPKRGKGGRRKRSNPRRASASSVEKNAHGLDADSIARMQKYGLKLDLLDRQPVWALRFVALALRFVEQEQLELPSRLFHEELARREKVALSGVNGVQAGHTTTTTEATAAAAAAATTTTVKSTKTSRSTKNTTATKATNSNGSAGKTAGKQTAQQTSKRGSSKKAVPAKTATKKSSARKPARAGARRGASSASSKTAKGGKAAQQRAGAASEAKAGSGGTQNIPPATQRKRDLDPDSARELWTSVKREAKGIARQRVCNLIIALSKLRHRMDTRIRLGFEGAMENARPMWTQFQASSGPESFPERAAAAAAAVAVSSSAANRQENWGAMSPSKGRERVSQHNQKVRDLVNETTAKLVERVWWVGDRCEARWCGDDAEDYPGWYSGTILHVHPNPLSKEQGSAYEKSLSSLSGTDANQPTKDSGSANPSNDPSEAATPAASQSVSAADSEAASEMPPVPNENGSKMETDAANASEKKAGETTLSADPASKKYFDALLRGPSVHILYDDGSVLNRIPIGSDVLRRPQLTDHPDYPEPHVALSTKTHQSPFRPLTDEDVMNALWNDRTNSVMQRVLRLLERTCVYYINVWQAASDPRIKSRYWWNIKTRAIHKGKPPVADRAEKMTYVPKAMREIRELGKYCVGSIEEARDGIRRLRDLVLKVPGVAQSEDGQVWKDGKMDDAHQKLVDLLTFYSLTENWFQVTEAPPVNFYGPDNAYDPTAAHSLHHESSVVAPLLGWLDQKEENMLVEQLMGTTVLPEVESAYTPIEAAKYGSHVRNRLMKQLGDNKKRYQDWDKETQRMFAPAPHVHTDLQADAWPPPLPPPRLFGSPVLDAALFDNRNFDGVASGFEGRLDDVYFKKQVLEEHDKPASAEGDDVFQRLLTALKATRRSASRFPGKEGQMFSPPPPPTVNQHVWIRCEAKDCEKWRKLPAGYSAADFPENFTCSMLKRVDPHFASCTVPEEPSTGESSLKWGYGIGSVDDLQSGHRIDAYHRRSRKWFAVEIVDARTDAVHVVFPKQAGRAEDWLPRHPGPGQFASIMPLYSFSDRADDRSGQRVYRYVETTKRELSKFGPKALMKDYQQYASGAAESSGLPKISIQAVIGTIADLVNQVSADGGEPLGRVEVKVRRKVLVDEGHLSPSNAGTAATAAGPGLLRRANSTQSSLSATATVRSAAARDRDRYRLVQREAMFMFFKEMKRLYGGLISFEDISRQADALDDRQISYLNPTSWSSNRYGAWVDAAFDEDIGVSMEQDPAERDEEHVVVGMQVMTPDGLGVVLRRTGIRTYCVAVAAARSMRVETQFGWGTVDLVREGTPPIAQVSLDSGARMFAPDLAVEVEYLLVIPVEALAHAKLANVPLEQLLKTRQPRGPRGGDHSPSSSSTTLKREISEVSPFPQPAAVSKVKTEVTGPAQAPRVELAQDSRAKADVETQPMEIVKEASAPDTRAQHGVSDSTATATTSSSSSSTSVKQAAVPGTDSEQQTKTLSVKDLPDTSEGAVPTSTSAAARSDSEAGDAAPAKVNAEAVGDGAPDSDASKALSGSAAANLTRSEEKAEPDSAESAVHGPKAATVSDNSNAIKAAPSEEKGANKIVVAPGVEKVESRQLELAAHESNDATVSSESAAVPAEAKVASESAVVPGEEKVVSRSTESAPHESIAASVSSERAAAPAEAKMANETVVAPGVEKVESRQLDSAAHESNAATVSSESVAVPAEAKVASESAVVPSDEKVEARSTESAAHESNAATVSSESAAVPAEAKVVNESAVAPGDEKVESRSMESAAHESNAATVSSESAAAHNEEKAANDRVVAPGEEKAESRSSESAAHESNAAAVASDSAAAPSEEKAPSESVVTPGKEKVEFKVLESAVHESNAAAVASDDSAAKTTPAELKVANNNDTSGSASTEAPAVRKEVTPMSEFPTLIANVTKTEGKQEETQSKNESTPSLAPSAS